MYEFLTSFDLDIRIRVSRYIPERQPPECRNPSSPVFSDDGEKEEIEYQAFFVIGDAEKEIPLPQELLDVLDAEILNEIRMEKKL